MFIALLIWMYSRVVGLIGLVPDGDVVVSVPVGPDPEERGGGVGQPRREAALQPHVLALRRVHRRGTGGRRGRCA